MGGNMNREEYIKKAEEIRDYIIEETVKRTAGKPSKSYDKMFHSSVEALYQLHLKGVRDVIGEDEDWGTYGDYGDREEMEKDSELKSLRNQLRAEQREKLKK